MMMGGLTVIHSISMMNIPLIFREIQLLSRPKADEEGETKKPKKPKSEMEKMIPQLSNSETKSWYILFRAS